MGVHATASVGITYFLYLKYLRYIIADFESLALVFLNPKLLLEAYPSIKAALTAAVVVAGVLLVNLRTVPLSLLRLLRGGFGFCAGFLLLYFATALLSQYIGTGWNVKLFHSTHLFVEVLEDSTAIHTKPSTDSPVLKRVNSGTLLLLTDLSDQGVLSWNKVLVSPTLHGWIQRFTSAKFDQSTRRLTQTEKFYFRYQDLLALLAGLTGFLWGIASFRIRPV